MNKKCLVCGKSFNISPCRAKTAKYCSHPCRKIGLKNTKITKLLEEYKKQLCACGCGEYLNPKRRTVGEAMNAGYKIKYKQYHYSRTDEHTKSVLKKEEHPMFGKKGNLSPVWKGGIKKRTDYGENWYYQRKKARIRDNYTCKECGKSKYERRIDVHHVIPFKDFDNYKEANKLSNLICYCYKCHMLKEWEIREKRMNSGKTLAIG